VVTQTNSLQVVYSQPVSKTCCNYKELPQCDAHYNSVPNSSSPLFPSLPLPVSIPSSFFLYTRAPLRLNILFRPRLLLIVAVLIVEHAAEIKWAKRVSSSLIDKR